jgi:hypothetical protein
MKLHAKNKVMFGEDFDDPAYFLAEELKISDLNNNLILVTDSQDATNIKEYLGRIGDDYDSFFVKVEDGDFAEVYGFYGIIPELNKICYKLI